MRCIRFRPWMAVIGLIAVAAGAAAQPHSPEKHAEATTKLAAGLTLGDLEQLAIQGNPTLAQAAAQVEAARGRLVQAGLYPNPTVGYEADEIGNDRSAGQHGAFIDQLMITGGKLRLNRAKFQQELAQMESQALAQQYRVLNGVRSRFWQVLAIERLLAVRTVLLKNADDVVKTTEELLNVGQANRPDLLQARIEARQQRVGLENARARHLAAWKQLAALVGSPCLEPAELRGELDAPGSLADFDAVLKHLLEASPEIHFAHAGLTRNQIAVRRERVEPIPNIRVRAGAQYNFETSSTQALAQIGVTLPIFDRNQGNIRVAEAQLAKAEAEITRVELSLRKRLAQTYADYETAGKLVETYRSGTLPDAREAYQLYLDSFAKRRAAYPQVLVAQRNLFQYSTDYIEALARLRHAETAILGLLLGDGLEEPPDAPSEGGRFRRSEGTPELPLLDEGRSLEDRLGRQPGD
jgi:outer membrane protein, heavy metal efflux system